MSSNLQFEGPPGSGRTIVAPSLYSALDESGRERLRARAPVSEFEHEAIIQSRGDLPRGFWVVDEGHVMFGLLSPDGGFRAVGRLGPGDSCGDLALLAGRVRAVDAISDGPSTLRFITANDFERELSEHHDSMRRILQALSLQLQELLTQIHEEQHGSPEIRVLRVLYNLGVAAGGSGEHKIGQRELAYLTGMSRASVNKCLAEIEAEGLIKRGYGKIEVLDHAAVERMYKG